MPPVGFEPTISAGELPQTYALDRAATRTGKQICKIYIERVGAVLQIGRSQVRSQLV